MRFSIFDFEVSNSNLCSHKGLLVLIGRNTYTHNVIFFVHCSVGGADSYGRICDGPRCFWSQYISLPHCGDVSTVCRCKRHKSSYRSKIWYSNVQNEEQSACQGSYQVSPVSVYYQRHQTNVWVNWLLSQPSVCSLSHQTTVLMLTLLSLSYHFGMGGSAVIVILRIRFVRVYAWTKLSMIYFLNMMKNA